ncbi:MAG: DUF1622 domain-containing protein [Candidatus Sericytochromatia bacterium]
MEELFKTITMHLANVVELLAALVITLAVLKATAQALATYFRLPMGRPKEEIRLHLGRWLALALEFTLAADILETAVAPTWDDIGKLGAIIVLRTLLNHFLQRDVEHAESRGARDTPA